VSRIQIAATGAGMSASALLLSCGLALVANTRTPETPVRFDTHAPVVVAQAPQARVQQERALAAALRQVRDEADGDVDRILQECDRSNVTTTASEPANLAPIRAAVLTGSHDKIVEAVARHNASGAEPVFLHDDPELVRRGIAVRARWPRHGGSRFAVSIDVQAGDSVEPCTVLVAPGALVKAGDDGEQDTTPIQARFIHVGPYERSQADAEICCAQIHSQDPRGHEPAGLTSHRDPRVGLVAATAEREHASWGAAQVAVWAVANDATPAEVASAPGSYTRYIDPARDVLEKAGIDTNKLPLYAHALPRMRKDAFDMDLLGHIRGG